MAMTVVVTRDVPDRFRGFLASCMLEIAAGVYTAPDMTMAVRERIWNVLTDWYASLNQGAVVITWPDAKAPGGQRFMLLGDAPKDLYDAEGIVLAVRPIDPASGSMTSE